MFRCSSLRRTTSPTGTTTCRRDLPRPLRCLPLGHLPATPAAGTLARYAACRWDTLTLNGWLYGGQRVRSHGARHVIALLALLLALPLPLPLRSRRAERPEALCAARRTLRGVPFHALHRLQSWAARCKCCAAPLAPCNRHGCTVAAVGSLQRVCCTARDFAANPTRLQENFTLQISGVKRWRFRRADVQHPLTAFTPHFKASTRGTLGTLWAVAAAGTVGLVGRSG